MKKNSNPNTGKESIVSNKKPSVSFPIVGVGASAGGLEALEQFFNSMSNETGMAFVIIQHLAPNCKGMMPELLQRLTPNKVYQATDKLKLKPNCVYVIPPNKSMSMLNGYLYLFEPVKTHGLRLPIDFFFRSMAHDRGQNSIGVILSGMGSDGSLGIKAIKEKNGLVLVQDPASAQFDGMPRSAINAVVADVIAPAEELHGRIISLLKLYKGTAEQAEKDPKILSDIDKIIILIRDKTGHDFSLYKKTTLLRRIDRRKGIHEIDEIHTYVRYLQENPNELEILYKELLIGVTNFFRDKEVWDALRDDILPSLIEELPDGYAMRVWVTGCSTGEEAYSLAIVFKEAMKKVKNLKNVSLKIFATDIDDESIEKARRGYFLKNIVSDVSPDRIKQFFKLEGKGYRINKSIREMVVFAIQNVTKDPPFTKLDLITCRNMLIYMEPELQNKLISLFNFSLNENGILVLGAAESPGEQTERFNELYPKLKIYKSISKPNRPNLIDFPGAFNTYQASNEKASPLKVVENIQTVTEKILLQHYTPASVLVNSKGDIIYITGRTGKYLEPISGKANWNIFAMAREGLNSELPRAFRKAMKTFEPVQLKGLKIGIPGDTRFVDVTVQPIEKPEMVKGMIMLIFKDVESKPEIKTVVAKKGNQPSNAHLDELELELKRAIEFNQSVQKEMQTSKEELQSTNEELESTNEELQLTNEELTTSKEEMQSMNEELQTVNIELQNKVADFTNAHNDMENLLNSTEIAVLFLDKELTIRRFTHTMTNIFKIRDTDVGRPFTDLVSSLQYEAIETDARKVIKTLITIEKVVSTIDDKWIGIRIMPYRTTNDRIDGLVMTFNDISKSKQLELALRESGTMLRLFIQKVQFLIIGLSFDGKIIEFNPVAEKVFGYKRKNILGKSYVDIFIPEALRKNVASEFRKLWKDHSHSSFLNHVKSSRGEQLKIEWTTLKLFDEKGMQTGIITIGEDITKQAEGT